MTVPSYSLERHLSIHDIRDAPPLATASRPTRYATVGSRQYHHPPQRFFMTSNSTYNQGRILCSPGSIFEGKVEVILTHPLMCLNLSVMFKGEEKVASSGKTKHLSVTNRLFGIRTLLWGDHHQDESSKEAWPILEPGHHVFPFMIEMPLVNYPPSFYHPFVTCDYTIYATLERPGERPFKTQQLQVLFEPIIGSTHYRLQHNNSIQQKIPSILPHFDIQVNIPHHVYTISESTHIPIRLTCINDSTSLTSCANLPSLLLCAKLQRHIKVIHNSFFHQELSTLQQVTSTWLLSQADVLEMKLPLVTDLYSSSSNSNMITCPSIDYAKHFHIQYTIILSAKIRGRLTSTTKKESISIPIFFTTLNQETKPPAALVPFTHQEVINDDTLNTKPRFIPPPSPHLNDTILPPYDPIKPPSYN
ncbi:uncharacterized protein BX664DRAFT_141842 [Halteromyces radiatus]|uniref:uncharacterized protein n=1 Tax=Halteromyces radiatus TaxID=101107 RepID=UPI002220E8C0|nr:uncharacterized protein BX664DRAFT_141842 [Halteromyces radiatus]KAI8089801.1 hypothetical protein BX664DRAFT_141842 [Halteromyces radiatus]